MKQYDPDIVKEVLNGQHTYWEKTFGEKPEMFGSEPSEPARRAAELFKREGKAKILELGCGQGRDSIFFAGKGFQVCGVDYSKAGIQAITQKAHKLGLSRFFRAVCHDVRKPLPFIDDSFDACYSHMLYCMALTSPELERLSQEVRRVLKPGGLNIYTVRNTQDPHYGTGIQRGEALYEVGGFIVHFFDRQLVEHLAKGFELVDIGEFEEGRLPRKLFLVTLRKQRYP
jgi:SAM-dependent methyltransferase